MTDAPRTARRVLTAPPAHEGPLLTNNKPFEMTVAVRKDRVTARVDGQTIVDWPADYRRCRTRWEFPDRHRLGLATWRSAYHFTAIEVRPPDSIPPAPAERPPATGRKQEPLSKAEETIERM